MTDLLAKYTPAQAEAVAICEALLYAKHNKLEAARTNYLQRQALSPSARAEINLVPLKSSALAGDLSEQAA